MNFDRKLMHRMFFFVAGCIVFAWLILDTARATALALKIWDLIAPFAVGAGIAFVFNVPMRAIENSLRDIRRPGLRRTLAIVLTIFLLVLVIMFVIELLIPQIRQTVASLMERFPAFAVRVTVTLREQIEENPELGI